MIQIIHGGKGTGKTKTIIALANQVAGSIKGSTVFIDTDNSYMYDLDYSIRFINIDEFCVSGAVSFMGFLGGLCASDNDLEYVFCDSFLKIVQSTPAELEHFFAELEKFAGLHNLHIVLSVNESAEQLPAFMRKFLQE